MTATTPKRTDTFSTREAARISGVRYASLDYWARTGLIAPSVAEARGTGTERRYSFKDLVALRVARELRHAGISTNSLRAAISRVRGVANPLAESRILVIGTSVVWVSDHQQIMDVLKAPGQTIFAFMLDFPRAVSKTQEEVKNLRAA